MRAFVGPAAFTDTPSGPLRIARSTEQPRQLIHYQYFLPRNPHLAPQTPSLRFLDILWALSAATLTSRLRHILGTHQQQQRCHPLVSLPFSIQLSPSPFAAPKSTLYVYFMETPEVISCHGRIEEALGNLSRDFRAHIIQEIPYQFKPENPALRILDSLLQPIPPSYAWSISRNIALPPTKLILSKNYERFIYLTQRDNPSWSFNCGTKEFSHSSLPFKLRTADVHMLQFGLAVHVSALPPWHQRRIQNKFPDPSSLRQNWY